MTVLGWGEEMSVPKVTPRPPEIAPGRQATPVMALSLLVSWVLALTAALKYYNIKTVKDFITSEVEAKTTYTNHSWRLTQASS